MENNSLAQQFSIRLREAMITAGFQSTRSASGISMTKLAEITGYSLQICRKYIRGEAIPDPVKLMDIAQKLQVSAGWLLFGDTLNKHVGQDCLAINKKLLHYVFQRASVFYRSFSVANELPNFLIELVQDICLLNIDLEQSKKIVDLAFASVNYFKPVPAINDHVCD